MLYLVLATCSNAVMAIVLKIFQEPKGNRYGIILGNYLVCILIAFFSLPDRSIVLKGSGAALVCGLIGGAFYVAGLVTMQTSTRLNGATLTAVFSKMGVDIPEINQVIMLRPTESPVMFIQQLGRGLRKFDNKEYVVILDFIGNYTNNYMIPIALSDDRSYNKDTMRRYVQSGARIIPGSSTIHFDEVSRKRIFASIDAAKTMI